MFSIETSKLETGDQEITRPPGNPLQHLPQTVRGFYLKFGMVTHLDVAAEQSSFVRHDGLDDNSLLISNTVHALLITKCEGKALSLISLVPRRHGFEAWRSSRKSTRAKVEIAQQRS